MVVHVRNGARFVSECVCRRDRVLRQRLERSGIPRKYTGVRLADFQTKGMDPSIGWAATFARGIVTTWPMVDRGLLLCGTCGVGKTHLAAAMLAELVAERGASGRFWDVSELLVQLKRGFNREAAASDETPIRSEGSMFEEMKRVDVLVLDDLGADRATDWAFDEVRLMISGRYNAGLLTVLTSNFPNLGPGEGRAVGGVKQETLGDRVGARTWSRLQEMCRPMEMVGADFRRKRA